MLHNSSMICFSVCWGIVHRSYPMLHSSRWQIRPPQLLCYLKSTRSWSKFQSLTVDLPDLPSFGTCQNLLIWPIRDTDPIGGKPQADLVWVVQLKVWVTTQRTKSTQSPQTLMMTSRKVRDDWLRGRRSTCIYWFPSQNKIHELPIVTCEFSREVFYMLNQDTYIHWLDYGMACSKA